MHAVILKMITEHKNGVEMMWKLCWRMRGSVKYASLAGLSIVILLSILGLSITRSTTPILYLSCHQMYACSHASCLMAIRLLDRDLLTRGHGHVLIDLILI